MFKVLFAFLLISFQWTIFTGCGNDHSEKSNRKRMVADSIRTVDSLEKNKVQIAAQKKSEEDSVLEAKEFEAQVTKYDSLRKMDSLKVKWKRRDPIKPAPKRELWAKSPIK